MQPIIMIHKAVQFMDRRLELLANLSAWAIRLEIVKQGPSAQLILSGHEMTVKVMGVVQTAVERIAMAINHIVGAMRLRVIERHSKHIGFGTQFQDCSERTPRKVLFGPIVQGGRLGCTRYTIPSLAISLSST